MWPLDLLFSIWCRDLSINVLLNFQKLSERYSNPIKYLTINLNIFYVKLPCILFLELTELAFVCCLVIHNLNTLNTLRSNINVWYIEWETHKYLVLLYIIPILRAPDPVPKYWEKTTDLTKDYGTKIKYSRRIMLKIVVQNIKNIKCSFPNYLKLWTL